MSAPLARSCDILTSIIVLRHVLQEPLIPGLTIITSTIFPPPYRSPFFFLYSSRFNDRFGVAAVGVATAEPLARPGAAGVDAAAKIQIVKKGCQSQNEYYYSFHKQIPNRQKLALKESSL